MAIGDSYETELSAECDLRARIFELELEVERYRSGQRCAECDLLRLEMGEYIRRAEAAEAEVERLRPYETQILHDPQYRLAAAAEAKFADEFKFRAQTAESERDELRQQVEALQAKVHLCASVSIFRAYDALEAKLRAVEGLPEKWRRRRNESRHPNNLLRCADELETILRGEQP